MIYWAWAIKNAACVICFTILAIVFDKWWVALFALLFMSSLQAARYYRICDKCGKHSESADTYDEALKKAKEAGWLHDVNTNEDYCPDCKLIK